MIIIQLENFVRIHSKMNELHNLPIMVGLKGRKNYSEWDTFLQELGANNIGWNNILRYANDLGTQADQARITSVIQDASFEKIILNKFIKDKELWKKFQHFIAVKKLFNSDFNTAYMNKGVLVELFIKYAIDSLIEAATTIELNPESQSQIDIKRFTEIIGGIRGTTTSLQKADIVVKGLNSKSQNVTYGLSIKSSQATAGRLTELSEIGSTGISDYQNYANDVLKSLEKIVDNFIKQSNITLPDGKSVSLDELTKKRHKLIIDALKQKKIIINRNNIKTSVKLTGNIQDTQKFMKNIMLAELDNEKLLSEIELDQVSMNNMTKFIEDYIEMAVLYVLSEGNLKSGYSQLLTSKNGQRHFTRADFILSVSSVPVVQDLNKWYFLALNPAHISLGSAFSQDVNANKSKIIKNVLDLINFQESSGLTTIQVIDKLCEVSNINIENYFTLEEKRRIYATTPDLVYQTKSKILYGINGKIFQQLFRQKYQRPPSENCWSIIDSFNIYVKGHTQFETNPAYKVHGAEYMKHRQTIKSLFDISLKTYSVKKILQKIVNPE